MNITEVNAIEHTVLRPRLPKREFMTEYNQDVNIYGTIEDYGSGYEISHIYLRGKDWHMYFGGNRNPSVFSSELIHAIEVMRTHLRGIIELSKVDDD